MGGYSDGGKGDGSAGGESDERAGGMLWETGVKELGELVFKVKKKADNMLGLTMVLMWTEIILGLILTG